MQCFLCSGFDNFEVILQMDITEGPDNAITVVIERYIDKKKFPRCMGPHQDVDKTFEFPPGHKIRIKNTVQGIKDKYSETRVRSATILKVNTQSAEKKSKNRKIDEESTEGVITDTNVNSITN